MRTREEILEDTKKERLEGSINEYYAPKLTMEEATLEVLLDIRDLLNEVSFNTIR